MVVASNFVEVPNTTEASPSDTLPCGHREAGGREVLAVELEHDQTHRCRHAHTNLVAFPTYEAYCNYRSSAAAPRQASMAGRQIALPRDTLGGSSVMPEHSEKNLIVGPALSSRTDEQRGTKLGWMERALDNMLARQVQNPPRWVTLAQRLLSFAELDDLLRKVETDGHPDRLSALAEALNVRYLFNGLDNLEMVGDRPVILFGNHPIGGGNALGMFLLLAKQFPDYRIVGSRHMKFIFSLSEKIIPVDPFRSTSALNLEALVKLRREFGTQYQALGLFPAGNSSQLKLSGAISDRRWSDAFIRIARHHDALLVPLWFSGRNRLRYYIASKIRAELGFLALPAEFLRLRGKSITVNIGKPISPDALRAIPSRRAQLSFLRAGVYELERERAAPAAANNLLRPLEKGTVGEEIAGGRLRSHETGAVRRVQPRAVEPVPVGEHLELRFFDGAAAGRIEELAETVARDGLDGATTHVVLTPRDRLVPCAHWQVLDWGQFEPGELARLSPMRRSFRLHDDVAHEGSNWLEIVGFAIGSQCAGLATLQQVWMGLRASTAISRRAADLVTMVTPQETSFVLAALQFAVLQKARGDAALLHADAALDIIGATQHHDWKPHRDAVGGGKSGGWGRMGIDPVLRTLAGIGVRFGAAGLSVDCPLRPCILGRLSLAQ
jgi:putative hemolysin